MVNPGVATGNILDDGCGNVETAAGNAVSGSGYGDNIAGGAGSELIWGNEGNETLSGGADRTL